MIHHPDVDIDFANRNLAAEVLTSIPAMMERDGKTMAHPSGVYLQDVPVNPFTRLASLPYEVLDHEGYFKIDLLNQSVYEDVRDEAHLETLLATEPLWELLDERGMVEQLPHIHSHYGIVQEIAPKSVEDLAIVIALVRPGKKYLRGNPREVINSKIWSQEEEGYTFRKAHAISYATLIVVKMNLLVEAMLAEC